MTSYLVYKKAIDNRFEESKHPRDKNGCFTHVITINVPKVDDLKNERKRLEKWYVTNIQGSSVVNPYVGSIKLTRNGIKETLRHSTEQILAAIPHIQELLKNGKFEGWKNLTHERKDDYVQFGRIVNTIKFDNEIKTVACFVAKDKYGNVFYQLCIDKGINSYLNSNSKTINTFDNDIIDQDDLIVNIFFI